MSLDLFDIDKAKRNEETTKLQLITPVIQKKWGDIENILMEYPISDGRILIDDEGNVSRSRPKKADYLLLWYKNVPLAIVEAKGQDHSADDGYVQAVEYARLLDVPFAYATNGHELIEKDMLSGLNKSMVLSDFPSPNELWLRFKKESNLSDKNASVYATQYYDVDSDKVARYYQKIMINRVTKAILDGQNRILLVSATGTGKTFIAFQIIWRLWKQGVKKRILYLADRNILVDQSMVNDFKAFGNRMCKIDNSKMDTSYELYFALYQQLQQGNNDYYKYYDKDFFDLVVVDECHRGSANDDSNWRKILEWFSSATQIGLTATPKDDAESDYANISYFGKPVYTYSLKQGIEDGFLAPYLVVVSRLNIDVDGWYPPKGYTDINGDLVEPRLYTMEDFDRNIVVDERRDLVAKRITDYLMVNDMRYAKTIVFCESVAHAQDMVRRLENLNSDLVAEDSRYVMQITGDNDIGKQQLENFINPSSKYPVIAVTSRLMSTGVDAQTCELIVLDRVIGSMTEFKQIIGRGTRVKEHYDLDGENKSKMYFTILDFRKNYEKFNDPDFDGYPDLIDFGDGDFKPRFKPKKSGGSGQISGEPKRIVTVMGVDVKIVGETVNFVAQDGSLTGDDIVLQIRNNILSHYLTFGEFQDAWCKALDKKSLVNMLVLDVFDGDWISWAKEQFGYTVDYFDIICYFAYGMYMPKSKSGRVHSDAVNEYLKTKSDKVCRLFELLLDVYQLQDFDTLCDIRVFNLKQFKDAGWTMQKAVKLFGNRQQYLDTILEFGYVLYGKEV